MSRAFVLYRVTLIIVTILAFALEDSQKSNASTDNYNMDYPNDSQFSLPFDSGIADQPDDGDYQPDIDILFP